jgi:pimeloyl-ACP methyl ester carboxylesterase/DNA-binding CsgD family transcriptional regulator
MEPLIQYAEASDNVRIAYYTMGRGVPFVVTSMLLWGHLGNTQVFKEHHRSQSPGGLGRGMQIMRYDARGTGLSERGSIDFSLEAQMRDLDAVRSALKLDRFALFGRQAGCPLALTYAATHPDRVTHLVLSEPIVRGSDVPHAPAMAGMQPASDMTHQQWEAFTLAMANMTIAYSSQSLARRMAREYRDAMTPQAYRAYVQWRSDFDVSHMLPRIDVPTLVLSPRRAYYQGIAPSVAAAIKNARIFTVEADNVISGRWLPETTAVVEGFLGIAETTSSDGRSEQAERSEVAHLTQREREVLALLVAGRSNREIADALVLSERTVARHIANMYQKAGVHGRAEITAYALTHRLV